MEWRPSRIDPNWIEAPGFRIVPQARSVVLFAFDYEDDDGEVLTLCFPAVDAAKSHAETM